MHVACIRPEPPGLLFGPVGPTAHSAQPFVLFWPRIRGLVHEKQSLHEMQATPPVNSALAQSEKVR
jgi:hypothetical protein